MRVIPILGRPQHTIMKTWGSGVTQRVKENQDAIQTDRGRLPPPMVQRLPMRGQPMLRPAVGAAVPPIRGATPPSARPVAPSPAGEGTPAPLPPEALSAQGAGHVKERHRIQNSGDLKRHRNDGKFKKVAVPIRLTQTPTCGERTSRDDAVDDGNVAGHSQQCGRRGRSVRALLSRYDAMRIQ
jgi:hypothetical protein